VSSPVPVLLTSPLVRSRGHGFQGILAPITASFERGINLVVQELLVLPSENLELSFKLLRVLGWVGKEAAHPLVFGFWYEWNRKLG
jgi:hypothetical protein